MLSEIPWRNRIRIILSSTFGCVIITWTLSWMDVTIHVFSLFCFCLLCLYRFFCFLKKCIRLLLHTQYIQKSSLWKNIHVITIKIIWTKVIRLYLLYLKPVVFTFLFPVISFHLKYHICAVNPSRILFFFLWLNSFYIHLPAVLLLRKVGGNMLLNIVWYLGKNLLSNGRNWSSSSMHIAGYPYANCGQFKKGIIVQTVRFISASLWTLVLYFKSWKFTIKFVFISYAKKYFAVTGNSVGFHI